MWKVIMYTGSAACLIALIPDVATQLLAFTPGLTRTYLSLIGIVLVLVGYFGRLLSASKP